VKYPFLEESMEYIRPRVFRLKLEDLETPDYKELYDKVKKRVITSVKRGITPIFDDMYKDVDLELLSFLISVIVLKSTNDELLISRYSLAEAKRAESFLRQELGHEEGMPIIKYVFEKVTPYSIEFSELPPPLSFKLKLIPYLKLTTNFNGLTWKLSNRIVDRGYVYVKDREVVRLIRESSYRLIMKRMYESPNPLMPPKLQKLVEALRGIRPIHRAPSLPRTPTEFPPCIKVLLNKVEKGENISHFGRFFLTTFLLAIGWEVEKVINLYSTMPDFNESMTRYQVEHIAGLRGGRKRYSVPSCKLLITYGLCFKNDYCGDIRSPLRYMRKKG
jgi:DNA primase large subunit